MSQAVGSYATEGTQYGKDASYYLLDTVPGPGAVLAGPITITGNLTTTGTTLSQGPLGAPSVATSAVTSTGNLAITSGTGNVTVTAVAGDVTVQSSAGQNRLTLDNTTGDITLTGDKPAAITTVGNLVSGAYFRSATNGCGLSTQGTQKLSLSALGTAGFEVNTLNAPMIFNNLGASTPPARFTGQLGLDRGLSCEGSFADPVLLTSGTKAMTTNKAFYRTDGSVAILIIQKPPTLFNVSFAIIKGIGLNSYAPVGGTPIESETTIQFGFVPGVPQFFSICLL